MLHVFYLPLPLPRPRFGGGSVGGFIKLLVDWFMTTYVTPDCGGPGGGGGPIAEAVAEIGGWGGILLDLGNGEAAADECAGGKYTALDFSLVPWLEFPPLVRIPKNSQKAIQMFDQII